jgi:hypothetical protein
METRSKVVRRWQDVIRAQEASGLSAGRYCRREKICAHSFYIWRKRLRTTAASAGGFVRLMPPEELSASIEITTPNGYRVGMRHSDEAVLRSVLLVVRAL